MTEEIEKKDETNAASTEGGAGVTASDEIGMRGKTESMEYLIKELGDNLLPFAEGDTVEATILAIGGNRIWVDVAYFLPNYPNSPPSSVVKEL